jgi:hypothetical protein
MTMNAFLQSGRNSSLVRKGRSAVVNEEVYVPDENGRKAQENQYMQMFACFISARICSRTILQKCGFLATA